MLMKAILDVFAKWKSFFYETKWGEATVTPRLVDYNNLVKKIILLEDEIQLLTAEMNHLPKQQAKTPPRKDKSTSTHGEVRTLLNLSPCLKSPCLETRSSSSHNTSLTPEMKYTSEELVSMETLFDTTMQLSFDSDGLAPTELDFVTRFIADLLKRLQLAANTQNTGKRNDRLTRCLSISIEDYMRRFVTYWPMYMPDGRIENTLTVMLIYIDRYIKLRGPQPLANHIHEIILGGFLLATQMLDDAWSSNDNYFNPKIAKIGGVTIQELVEIQIDFVSVLSYDLYVDKDKFDQYKNEILKHLDMHLDGRNAAPASTPAYR